MAIEFGSRKETFDNFKVYETMLAGRPFKVEMGKMCGLSNASALIRYGETCVMCNVVMSPKPREGVDFFPLNVEYEEKLYAAGRIPGSFMRREGRPGERAILTSRVVDRPMRPLFPKEMRNDVCITMTVMSLDPDCSPEIAGMIGASLVTAVSEIPWNGPIGGVQVGLVDGEIVLNPTQEQRKVSDLALTVAATMDKIVMIEAGANEVDEDTMLTAIKTAHVEIKKIIEFINKIVAERGKPKINFQVVGLDMDVFHAIQNKYLDDFKAAMDTDDKNVRDAALLPIMDKIAEEYPDLSAADLDLVSYKMQKFVVRRWLLDDEYEDVQCVKVRQSSNSDKGYDNPQVMLMRTKKGCFIDVEVQVADGYGYDIQCEVVCENGTVKLPDPYAVVCRSRPAGWDSVKPAESMPIMTDWKERFIEAYDIEFCKWVESVHAGKLTGPSSWDGYVACVAGDALNASRGTSQFLKVETMEKPEMYK